jgi:pilus assembly protein CpaF
MAWPVHLARQEVLLDKAQLHLTIRARLLQILHDKVPNTVDSESIGQLMDVLFRDLAREGIIVPPAEIERLRFEVLHEVYGFGAVEGLMQDPDVTEVMINGPYRIFAERHGQTTEVAEVFEDERALNSVVERLLSLAPGKRLDQASPLVDLSLPDGSRIHIAIPPVVAGGTHVTVRKYVRGMKTLDDYVESEGMDEAMAAFLHAAVRARLNILFSGAAGSGKTTLVEVLSTYLNPDERIVVIEDTLELHFRQPNVVRLLSRGPNIEGKGEITIADLFRNTLRMRPTRIVLGELRGREVLDYLQALNSGHRGAFAVIHAASPEQVVDRLENLVPYAHVNLPSLVIRRQIAHGLDLVVQHDQLADGSRKITRISEVGSLDAAGNVEIRDLFHYVETGRNADGVVQGYFEPTGVIPTFHERFVVAGLDLPRDLYGPPR